MDSNIENLTKYIPPHNAGYNYVKNTSVYIPIKDISLEILERKTQQLPFLFETILKLVALGITNVNHVGELLGLDENVYREVISQIGSVDTDLLFVSGDSMKLTSKGTEALADLKKITVKKTYMNDIFINTITGEIMNYEPRNFYTMPRPSCMCLDQIVDVDLDFFRKRTELINELYVRNAIGELVFGSETLDTQLYRILSIDSEDTLFFKLSCFVFIHPESGDILLHFNDDKDSSYLSAAMLQIHNELPGAMKLFDDYTKVCVAKHKTNEVKQTALDDLLNLLGQRGKTKIPTSEIEEKYYAGRYLLSGEIEELLINCSVFKSKLIFIVSTSIKMLFESSEVLSAITSSNVERLVLIYNENEYGADRSIARLKSVTKANRLKLECYPQSQASPVEETWIVASPGFAISTYFEEISTNYGKRILHKEFSEVTFSNSSVSAILNNLYTAYQVTAADISL